MAADGTKQPSTPEKIKDKEQAALVAGEKDGVKEGDEGPSAEVKEEESKDGAEGRPSKEKPNAMETAADSKPPGDKYSPKVSLSFPSVIMHCSVYLTLLISLPTFFYNTVLSHILLVLPIRELCLKLRTKNV